MGLVECIALAFEEECDDLVGTIGGGWSLECDGSFIILELWCAWASSSFSKMLYTSSKMYEFPNSAKTCCKTCAWSVGIPSNERRYWWASSRFMMLWVSSLNLKNFL
jgi:hypothetical protein